MPTLAFCPFAPVLVPEVAQGAAEQTAGVLAACDEAVRVTTAPAGSVLVVGPGPVGQAYGGSASGTLAGFGVPLRAGGRGEQPPAQPQLPFSLTMGAWLLDRASVEPARRRYLAVPDTSAGLPRDMASAFDGADTWLVMGDSTARLSERSPGSLDPDASAFDAKVLAALGSGDPATLATLDPAQGVRLMAAGVPAWRAVGAALLVGGNGERRWSAKVTAHEAPYGVSYLVATWT